VFCLRTSLNPKIAFLPFFIRRLDRPRAVHPRFGVPPRFSPSSPQCPQFLGLSTTYPPLPSVFRIYTIVSFPLTRVRRFFWAFLCPHLPHDLKCLLPCALHSIFQIGFHFLTTFSRFGCLLSPFCFFFRTSPPRVDDTLSLCLTCSFVRFALFSLALPPPTLSGFPPSVRRVP